MSLKDLGISLGKDEEIIAESLFSYSILLFFIKYSVYVTNKRFIARIPKVVLFLIPLGGELATYPLRNISNVTTKINYKLVQLFGAVLFTIFGFDNFTHTQSILGFAIFLFGVIMAVASFETLITVVSAGAVGAKCPIALWEKETALKFTNKVNQAITEIDSNR